MPRKITGQSGFVQPILALLVLIGVISFYKLLNTRVITHPLQINADVKGVFLARGGDDGGSSGGGDSHSGSDSGSSGGSSGSGSSGSSSSGDSGGSSSNTDSGSSGSSTSTSTKSLNLVAPKPTELRKTSSENLEIKRPEVENEDELENELDRELKDSLGEVEFRGVGDELELETKDATGAAKNVNSNKGSGSVNRGKKIKLNFDQLNGSQSANPRVHKEVELEANDNGLILRSNGIEADTDFPLTLNKDTGELTVNTPNGPKTIRILPDQAAEIAKSAGVATQIEKISLELNDTTSSESAVFKAQGIRTGNLFGFIPVVANVGSKIGAETGSILSVDQPFWMNIFGSLIF